MASPIEAVEASILANPDDAGAWEVYAAWLRAQGDPRGEWVARELPATTPSQRAQLAREREIWAPAGLAAKHCEWRHGFVVAATVRIDDRSDARRLATILAAPRLCLLSRLRL